MPGNWEVGREEAASQKPVRIACARTRNARTLSWEGLWWRGLGVDFEVSSVCWRGWVLLGHGIRVVCTEVWVSRSVLLQKLLSSVIRINSQHPNLSHFI